MILSKYTFTTKKYNSNQLLILNYLSNAVDLVDKNEEKELLDRIANNNWHEYHLAEYMLEKGYLYQSKEDEESAIQSKYIEFSEEYEKTPVQLIFSTSYTCNFACTYCFQESYHNTSKVLDNEITDKFFNYINKRFGQESIRPYITIFGGEPLLGSEKYKQALIYFLKKTVEYKYPIAIVTNGYELANYVPLFKELGASIKEIQVTVDGGKAMHDQRRFTSTKNPTFEKIMEGVDLALRNGYRINLRSIIDKDNIQSLPELAQYCNDMGFLDYPTSQFETSFGRNYELYTCQNTQKLFTRYDMWIEYYTLAQKFKILKKYHKPSFHGMRFLKENDELPFPIFDSCPAGKKEWAFDVKGNIYGCTASVGVEKYKLGSFLDNTENEKQILEWKTRDVLTIDECKNCPVSLSCGGGCGVIACNETQKIHSPNCRPVKELVSVGAAFYEIE